VIQLVVCHLHEAELKPGHRAFSPPQPSCTLEMDAVEFCESSTTTLEWTVKNLKNLFDSSKGDLKSKVCKSIKFGGGCVSGILCTSLA